MSYEDEALSNMAEDMDIGGQAGASGLQSGTLAAIHQGFAADDRGVQDGRGSESPLFELPGEDSPDSGDLTGSAGEAQQNGWKGKAPGAFACYP